MTPEDIHHLRAVGRATGGSTDYLGSFAEVRWTHDRRGYDSELLHILGAKVIETVHHASGDAQRLAGTNLNGRAVNRPGKNALDTVEDLLVGIVLVGRRRQLLSNGDENLEYGQPPLESSPVRRNRISNGPILMVSSEGLTLIVTCCIIGSLMK